MDQTLKPSAPSLKDSLQSHHKRHLSLASELLHHPDPAVIAETALALGTAACRSALPHLIRAWDTTLDAANRQPVVTAISCHRSDDAITWLIEHLEEARDNENDISIWVEALSPLVRDPRVAAAINEADSE